MKLLSFIFLSLFFYSILFGQTRKTFTTVKNGNWENSETWSGGNIPDCTINGHDEVFIDHQVESNCNPLELVNGTGDLIIRSGGNLQINSSTGLRGDGYIEVCETCSLTIEGNLDMTGSSEFLNNGVVTIKENLTRAGSAVFNNCGTLNIYGNGCSNIQVPSGCESKSSCRDLLPIRLLGFNVFTEGHSVIIQFTTASEKNNDYFIVERSKDGKTFESVCTIDGAGNSNVMIDYLATDLAPYAGISYYRIKQVDFDGANSFSWLESANTEQTTQFFFWPNPCIKRQPLNLIISNQMNEEATVIIKDILGKTVCNQSLIISTNDNTFRIDTPVNPGIYFISIMTSLMYYNSELMIR